MANKQRAIRNEVTTIFPLASASKPFTGAAVVQLAGEGKIDFGAPLGSYLDGFPAGVANTVTVHQLLTHTSGMGDYLGTEQWQSAAPGFTSAAKEFAAALAIIRAARCCSPPEVPTATATPGISRSARSWRRFPDCPIATISASRCSPPPA